MTLNDITDNIFVINLLRRQDRAQHMLEQSGKFGLTLQWVPAVDAREVSNPTHLRDGEWGLLLSHAKVLEYAKSRSLDKIIILEDDCYFHDDFNERLDREFPQVPEDWEVIMLSGNHYHLGAGTIAPEQVSQNIMRVFASFTTHALIIKNSVFDLILDAVRRAEKPLDVIYRDVIQSRGKTYAFCKNLGGQIDGFSDIIQFDAGYNAGGIYG